MLEDLKYYLVVAREENITHAAEQLHIAQPTLSRRLKKLEEDLGVRLIKRNNHNISLTTAGLIFQRRAQEMLDLSMKTQEELKPQKEKLTGEIRIACNESQSATELTDLIKKFNFYYPAVKFSLRGGNNNEIKEWLSAGQVDFGLLIEPVQVNTYNYRRLKLKDDWGILVNNSMPLAKLTEIHSQDIINKPMITIQDEIIHNELTSWAGKNANKMMPIVRYNLLSNAIPLVQGKVGFAVCHRPNGKYRDCKFIPLTPNLRLGSLLAWKAGLNFSQATNVFVDFVKTYIN